MDGKMHETSQWGSSPALTNDYMVVNVAVRIHVKSKRCRVNGNCYVQRRWRPLEYSKNQSIATAL